MAEVRPETVSIYALLDEQRQIRYVGYSKDPHWRARKHWRERGSKQTGTKNPGLNLWLRSLSAPPAVFVFEQATYDLRYVAEQYWTDLLRQIPGVELLNIASGVKLPPASRAKIGVAHRGKKLTESHRAKLSEALTGRQASDETRVKLRTAHLGKKLSPESIAKRSASVRGTKRSPEFRERMSAISKDREAYKLWCDECQQSWSRASWPRHIRRYHEGGAW